MKLNDPRLVRDEYASEQGLEGRRAAYRYAEGPDAPQMAFDAVAVWMLYHVPDVDRALAELARVLVPGGRLVAVTNAPDHLHELRELLGVPRRGVFHPFSGANGAELLRRHFARVEARDGAGTIRFPSRDEVLGYVESSRALFVTKAEVPSFEGEFLVTSHPVVFIAHTA